MGCIWRCPGSDQVLRINDEAIECMLRHRQTTHRSPEAGGQLFGAVCPTEVSVLAVTGPYARDDSGRYRYRSDPVAAQTAIDEQARAGRLYLGEWHTHAEKHPRPSGSDVEAMRALLARSRLNANSALLVIVGLSSSPDAMLVCSFGRITRTHWYFGALAPA